MRAGLVRLPARRLSRFSRADTHLAFAIAAESNIGLLLVRPESFDRAEARAILADLHAGVLGALLVGDRLHELADPESACVASGAACGKRVVGADHFVAISYVGLRAKKQRSVVAHVLEEVARIARHDLNVLVGEPVGLANRFVEVRHQNNLAVIAPGDGSNLGSRKSLELPFDFYWKGSRQNL